MGLTLTTDLHDSGGWCEVQSLTEAGWIRCKGMGAAIVHFPAEVRFYNGEMFWHMPFLASILNVCPTHSKEIEQAFTKLVTQKPIAQTQDVV